MTSQSAAYRAVYLRRDGLEPLKVQIPAEFRPRNQSVAEREAIIDAFLDTLTPEELDALAGTNGAQQP